MATLTFHSAAPPLRIDLGGAVRVGQTRVNLEIVIGDYLRGDSPETIAENYPTLNLADVYSVIGYYLKHRGEVDTYLAECERESEAIRKEVEERQGDPAEFWARLRARQAAKVGE